MCANCPGYIFDQASELLSRAQEILIEGGQKFQLPDAKERRRHAILRAATEIYSRAGLYRDVSRYVRICSIESAVGEAEALLVEIERREREELRNG